MLYKIELRGRARYLALFSQSQLATRAKGFTTAVDGMSLAFPSISSGESLFSKPAISGLQQDWAGFQGVRSYAYIVVEI